MTEVSLGCYELTLQNLQQNCTTLVVRVCSAPVPCSIFRWSLGWARPVLKRMTTEPTNILRDPS